MRRKLAMLVCVILIYTLVGCAGSNSNETVLKNDTANENTNLEATVMGEGSDEGVENSSEMVDLTTLSSTMVYAEVYNMMAKPAEYIGRTVKMQGKFVAIEDPESNEIYTACLIEDATACCAQGMEFILADGAVYPDDYPEVDSEITVIGVYETYEKDGMLYCYLLDATIE